MSDTPTNGMRGFLVWGGIVLGIISIVGGGLASGYVRDQNRVEESQKAHDAWILETNRALGRLEEIVKRLDQAVINQDEVLQREMRLLNDTVLAEIHAADTRFQDEISRSAAERRSQIEAVREDITTLRGNSLDRWTKTDALREQDRIEARIKALEGR